MHHAGGDLTDAAPRAAARLVGELHARGPRVHCITNTVAQAYTANMLLAAGGVAGRERRCVLGPGQARRRGEGAAEQQAGGQHRGRHDA